MDAETIPLLSIFNFFSVSEPLLSKKIEKVTFLACPFRLPKGTVAKHVTDVPVKGTKRPGACLFQTRASAFSYGRASTVSSKEPSSTPSAVFAVVCIAVHFVFPWGMLSMFNEVKANGKAPYINYARAVFDGGCRLNGAETGKAVPIPSEQPCPAAPYDISPHGCFTVTVLFFVNIIIPF